ncbi:uncharacterized protein LOC112178389 [Rosa chinensis]|uniref:uncharacterized protein LOC112178389 n=1 Tax=Rosa chinensis TaxID=74649 RepID=UPI000D08DE0F|nr:uncharacterized protein LOC112178389 [Rosa chinensis]
MGYCSGKEVLKYWLLLKSLELVQTPSGFQANLGIGEVLHAESWSLYYGLKQAISCGIDMLEIESDSTLLVKLVLDNDTTFHPLGSLISCYRNLLGRFSSVSLNHIFRECNMVADCFDKNSINHDYGVIEFADPPPHALQAYLDDLDSVGRPIGHDFDDV